MDCNTFKIIDFHTHPFTDCSNNICAHMEFCDMSPEHTLRDMKELNITHICGSVITTREAAADLPVWEGIKKDNQTALDLKERYQGFYIPGFHVHPDYVKESCQEIEAMSRLGVRLIGELVPYYHQWEDYACGGFDEILDVANQYHMIVSFHTMNNDAVDKMVEKHKNITFVAAHPGEYADVMRHMERMKKSENYYLDISGTGVFRHGMLKHVIDLFGAERILFGTDFPTCNPGVFIGGVLFDRLLTDHDKELIFYKNAARLLNVL